MRLIDADRSLEIVRDQGIAHPNAYHLTNYATLILQEAPTVEAKPVVHGEWILLGQRVYGSGGGRNYTHYCSGCGQHGFEDYKLCPNCGADMREREET